ncbi:MAG: hypothetical protein Q7J12_03050, partial [Syntrophales bacterium]|nr:hypothetical protein [Syntrophales bacterium]
SNTPSVIKTENIIRRYGDIVALNGLDLEVSKGGLFGFLRPNGAGKTTTIRILTRPTSERAFVPSSDHPKKANGVSHTTNQCLSPLCGTGSIDLLRIQKKAEGPQKVPCLQ